ncbi:G patch domain and ankyrin repeat-containing protein 1 [Engraulis encrasicolus]|uniref:G patch domain and ankyrin repeat-containing protein 1 n=1 Tax=Engraulis encrasicolus TaxID=184585 RepID=UPI002FD0E8CD
MSRPTTTTVFFTRGKEDEQLWTIQGGGAQNRTTTTTTAITGDEARHFYQNLFEDRKGEEEEEEEEEGDDRQQTETNSEDPRKAAGASSSGRKSKGVRGEERRKAPRKRRAGQHGGGCEGARRRVSATAAAHEESRTSRSAHLPQAQNAQVREREGHRLLRVAQDGDLSALRKLLNSSSPPVDINFHDDFYWTAVMCASHAGRAEAVALLLERGASWVGVVDTRGRDARRLAEQAGHQDVVRVLDAHGARTDDAHRHGQGTQQASTQEVPRWCSVCECLHSDSDGRHQASTLHQFNRGRLHLSEPVGPHYCLPPSSAGYRMMLRSGWNPGSGLGPQGQGPHQPVRTVLKRDQAGLGYGPSPRARVTHFQAKDPQAVRRTPKPSVFATAANERRERGATLSVQAQRRKEERQKGWERDFRSSFNIDP